MQTFPAGKVPAIFLGWGMGSGCFLPAPGTDLAGEQAQLFPSLRLECEKADWNRTGGTEVRHSEEAAAWDPLTLTGPQPEVVNRFNRLGESYRTGTNTEKNGRGRVSNPQRCSWNRPIPGTAPGTLAMAPGPWSPEVLAHCWTEGSEKRSENKPTASSNPGRVISQALAGACCRQGPWNAGGGWWKPRPAGRASGWFLASQPQRTLPLQAGWQDG